LQIEYNVPPGLVRWIPVARIYIQAENLFTLTGYSRLDPALPTWSTFGAAGDQRDQFRGVDEGSYPTNRTFTIGISTNFERRVFIGGRSTMNIRNRNRLLYGIVGVVVAAGVTYACKGFLDQPAQGTVEVASLETSAGVEGSLIAAYRSLDCSSSSAGSWGCAASNWVWV